MSVRSNAMMMVLIMAFMSLSGCFGEDEVELVEETSGYFDFIDMLDGRTAISLSGRSKRIEQHQRTWGNNIPYYSTSSYYSIGITFEPTMVSPHQQPIHHKLG